MTTITWRAVALWTILCLAPGTAGAVDTADSVHSQGSAAAIAFVEQPPRSGEVVEITGRVVGGTPPAPLAGVLVRAGTATTTTDIDGRFRLALPATGTISLVLSADGYLDQEIAVPVISGRATLESVMTRNPSYRETIEVSGRSSEVAARPPTLVLDPLTVSRVAGSADNVFRVLQTLPGVSATDDFGSRLAVRGGGPDQNLTVMDGVEIHNPYRLFGLTSAFNPETIDRFELTAGGFGAKYGDRLSSILLVENRSGTTSRRLAGSAAVSATDANVVMEGGMPRGSWLVTGRRTYYDIFAERITDNDLPSFDDVQTKAVWELRPGRRLTLFALRSREATDATFDGDRAGDRFGLKDNSQNDVASLAFSSPIGRRATSRTTVAWYRYGDALDVDGSIRNDAVRSNAPGDDDSFGRSAIVFTRSLGVRDVSLRQDVAIAATSRQTISLGGDAHLLRTDWGWTISGDRNPSEANGSSVRGGAGLPDLLSSSADSARAGAFVEDDIQIAPKIRVAGGVRLDWSGLAGESSVSPRLRGTIDLTARTKLRVATGLYTQSPGYEKLLQSDYFIDLSNTTALGLKSERSVHIVGGVEHEVAPAISVRAEAYHKTFDRAIAGRLETPAETAARVAQYDFPAGLASGVPTAPQITSVPDNAASGRSYGFDVYLEKRETRARDGVSGWISYTWGKATVDNYGFRYPFDYDRRHALSLVSTWRFIPRVDVAATLRVASGFPVATPVGVRLASTLEDGLTPGAPGSLVPRRDTNGLLMWTADYGDVRNLNGGRLPVYARLDVRFTYARSPASRWLLYLEGINVFNRDNASSLSPTLEYDPVGDRPRVTLTRDGGLPLFPSFGFRIRF